MISTRIPLMGGVRVGCFRLPLLFPWVHCPPWPRCAWLAGAKADAVFLGEIGSRLTPFAWFPPESPGSSWCLPPLPPSLLAATPTCTSTGRTNPQAQPGPPGHGPPRRQGADGPGRQFPAGQLAGALRWPPLAVTGCGARGAVLLDDPGLLGQSQSPWPCSPGSDPLPYSWGGKSMR